MDRLIDQRTKLHNELVSAIKNVCPDDTDNVWFKPSPNDKLTYPCIVYERLGDNIRSADNGSYFRTQGYQITVIDYDSDSEIVDSILSNISQARRSSEMVIDDLYHFIISISIGGTI